MEELDGILSQGALSDLSRMEARAQHLTQQQGALYQQLIELKQLRARVNDMRTQRDQLRAAHAPLQQGPLSLLHREKSSKPMSARQKELSLRKFRLQEKKAAYRLFGQSLSVVDGRTVRACIDTSYDGLYGTPHYFEVRLTADGGVLTRHTLPPFVPLENAKALMKTGLTQFTSHVQTYLQAHHVRKGFVQVVQREYADLLAEDIQTTPSVDWVKLSLSSVPQCGRAAVTLHLRYDNLESWLPTRVRVTIEARDSDDEDTARKRKDEASEIDNLFKTVDLPKAISGLIGE